MNIVICSHIKDHTFNAPFGLTLYVKATDIHETLHFIKEILYQETASKNAKVNNLNATRVHDSLIGKNVPTGSEFARQK